MTEEQKRRVLARDPASCFYTVRDFDVCHCADAWRRRLLSDFEWQMVAHRCIFRLAPTVHSGAVFAWIACHVRPLFLLPEWYVAACSRDDVFTLRVLLNMHGAPPRDGLDPLEPEDFALQTFAPRNYVSWDGEVWQIDPRSGLCQHAMQRECARSGALAALRLLLETLEWTPPTDLADEAVGNEQFRTVRYLMTRGIHARERDTGPFERWMYRQRLPKWSLRRKWLEFRAAMAGESHARRTTPYSMPDLFEM
jgi:hypothetical protein